MSTSTVYCYSTRRKCKRCKKRGADHPVDMGEWSSFRGICTPCVFELKAPPLRRKKVVVIKTEMKGTGGGRWTSRADAKQTSKKARRHIDRKEVAAQKPPLKKKKVKA